MPPLAGCSWQWIQRGWALPLMTLRRSVSWNLVKCDSQCTRNRIWKGIQWANDMGGYSLSYIRSSRVGQIKSNLYMKIIFMKHKASTQSPETRTWNTDWFTCTREQLVRRTRDCGTAVAAPRRRIQGRIDEQMTSASAGQVSWALAVLLSWWRRVTTLTGQQQQQQKLRHSRCHGVD